MEHNRFDDFANMLLNKRRLERTHLIYITLVLRQKVKTTIKKFKEKIVKSSCAIKSSIYCFTLELQRKLKLEKWKDQKNFYGQIKKKRRQDFVRRSFPKVSLNLEYHFRFVFLCKGQLISKCPYEKSVSSKIPTKIFLDFCPEIFCSFLGASW